MNARALLRGFAQTLAREGRDPLEQDAFAGVERDAVAAVVDEYLREQGIEPEAEFDPDLATLAARHRAAVRALAEEWRGRHARVCGPLTRGGVCERKPAGPCLHPWPLDELPPPRP